MLSQIMKKNKFHLAKKGTNKKILVKVYYNQEKFKLRVESQKTIASQKSLQIMIKKIQR